MRVVVTILAVAGAALAAAAVGRADPVVGAPTAMRINEWLADNVSTLEDPADGNFEDWFELYNPGPLAADLRGCYLTDNLANPTQFRIPNDPRLVIAPNAYLLVWADNESSQNSTNRSDLHVNFALGKSGDAIALFSASTGLVDAVSFGAQVSDITEGRYPDGSGTILTLPYPTPRAANVGPNSAPQLATLADRTAYVSQTLSVQAQAVDAEVPPQTLFYSLLPPVPGGASMSSNGLFTWPVPAGALPTTATVTVQVADSGVPPLSDTAAFRVAILPLPELDWGPSTGGELRVCVPAVTGQTYRIDFKPRMTDTLWSPASPPFTSPTSLCVIVAEPPLPTQGYYRVSVGP